MPFAHLNDRALISVSGPDAEHFLQNILTTDLDALAAGEAKPGALLAPQGKILFDFLISRAGENAFRLECRADVADDFLRRLMLYRLRAKVEIAKQDQSLVTVAWGDDSTASHSDSTSLADTRFRGLSVKRSYSGSTNGGDAGDLQFGTAQRQQYGDGIEAGQIVLAGSFIRPVEARHGDTINADFGPYGTIACHFL